MNECRHRNVKLRVIAQQIVDDTFTIRPRRDFQMISVSMASAMLPDRS
jgi:hypothetical protein